MVLVIVFQIVLQCRFAAFAHFRLASSCCDCFRAVWPHLAYGLLRFNALEARVDASDANIKKSKKKTIETCLNLIVPRSNSNLLNFPSQSEPNKIGLT